MVREGANQGVLLWEGAIGWAMPPLAQRSHSTQTSCSYPVLTPQVRPRKHETMTKRGLWRPGLATSRMTLAGYFTSQSLSFPI